MTTLLDVANFHLTLKTPLGHVKAIHGLNFKVHHQEIVGLVGESGCGKSLTAQSLVQLLPKEKHWATGEINLKGINLLALPEKSLRQIRRKTIGYVSQDPGAALNPTMKIGAQLTESLFLKYPGLSNQAARQQAIEWIERMGIPNSASRMNQYPHELSGGTKQRITLAMALCNQPELLIADEMTTALDATIQAQILTLLKELKTEHRLGMLLITHDLGVVANCCDRVLVMHGGKLVESGMIDSVFTSPQHPYTQSLLRSKKRLLEQVSHE